MQTPFHTTPAGLPAIAIPQLRETIQGAVIAPDDDEYDAARALRFAGFDRHPGAVVRAADARDVARTVTFARDQGIRVNEPDAEAIDESARTRETVKRVVPKKK